MEQITHDSAKIRSLRGKLTAAYAYFTERNAPKSAAKVRQLAEKLTRREFAIAFCGHFSAGKSKMINRLTGGNLLPSSPIPTSANLVRIKAGLACAKLFFKEGAPLLYPAPYDYELVKNYCKNGEQIREIEISHPALHLPQDALILDTPGIDSADDAHRVATESALHLADLIFYVMDYNHVQAELNFLFTKELTEAGKEIYLVINQIDKHLSRELPFEKFQQSAADAFASWGVKPSGIFYTSLKDDAHPHNQFAELQAFLTARLEKRQELLAYSVLQSLQKILRDYLERAEKKAAANVQSQRRLLSALSAEQQKSLLERQQTLLQRQSAQSGFLQAAEQKFDAQIRQILDNAYLMPFQTRALAESYLASLQSDFKVGLLFRRQKTLAEQKRRLEAFYQEIQERTKSQLEWHLRTFLLQTLKESQVENEPLRAAMQNFQLAFPADLLEEATKDGARLSGDYVLNYTNSVASAIKQLALEQLAARKRELLPELAKKAAAASAKNDRELRALAQYLTAMEQIAAQKHHANQERQIVEALLAAENAAENDAFRLFEIPKLEFEIITGDAPSPSPSLPPPKEQTARPLRSQQPQSARRLKQAAKKLADAAQWIRPLPGFYKLADEMTAKAARLEAKGFTVALFGAFSAGKSSFANALIGESVLPVSPNPMTAAVNKIKPVDALHPHGTVLVHVKTAATMLEDVNLALKTFAVHAKDLAQAAALIQRYAETSAAQSAAAKINIAFLRAFQHGFAAFGGQLGGTLTAALEAFGDYVTKEEKSCFIESIELYYDCALTRRGITLVDTPGADSINARHTGVAFEFIKNADAILFVTYYNHAFSKADREFLIQLGRVKDSFQLDKMFFIINAIDLADDAEDEETVRAYVRDQLVKYGVKQPHLYALSSQNALKSKQNSPAPLDAGMSALEENFYHFITHDLAALTVKSCEAELRRVAQLLENLLASAKDDAAAKQKKRAALAEQKRQIQKILSLRSVQSLQNQCRQEAEELLYYVKQRVFLRFNGFFKESFNPSVLRDDGRSLSRALRQSLEELTDAVGFDLAQELRATTVRLDRFAEKKLLESQAEFAADVGEIERDLSFSLLEWKSGVDLDFLPAFQDLPAAAFTKALSYFKNPKTFFEQNESRRTRDEIQRILDAAADGYLQKEGRQIQTAYEIALQKAFSQVTEHIGEQTDEFYRGLLAALDGGISAKHLEEIHAQIISCAAPLQM